MMSLTDPKQPAKIAVLLSTRRHPVSALPVHHPNDVIALALGLRLSKLPPRVMHAGDPQDAALGDYLAFGAATVEVLPAEPDDDYPVMLARHLRDVDLAICGQRAHNGSGMLPYRLAALLDRPVLGDVLDVQAGDGKITATQRLTASQRRKVEMPLRSVIAIHPQAAVSSRYIYASRIAGRIVTMHSDSLHECPKHEVEQWRLDPTERSAVVLRAPDRRSGHERMLSATATAAGAGRVITEGSTAAKAQLLLSYLREHHLIDN